MPLQAAVVPKFLIAPHAALKRTSNRRRAASSLPPPLPKPPHFHPIPRHHQGPGTVTCNVPPAFLTSLSRLVNALSSSGSIGLKDPV